MKLIQLGGANDALCHFLSFGGYELLLDCGARVLSQDPTLCVELPALHAIDVASLDMILVSNHANLLALPYLTEYLGFKGVVYATEMTMEFGRVLLEETRALLEKEAVRVSFRGAPSSASLPLFTAADVTRACEGVKCVEYRELVRLAYGVRLTALSSGYSLGSSLWLLESPSDRVAYVAAASGDLNRHPKELDFAPLIECDALILTDIKPDRDPQATTERTVEQLLAGVNRVLDRGGVCVIPSSPCGILFDLMEAIYAACLYPRSSQQQPTVLPMYCLSPMAEHVMDLTQCGAEWLCEKKIEKLYAGEPAFLHESLLQSNVLAVADTLSTSVLSGLQHGGVVFVGPSTLSFGIGADLVRTLGHDARHAVLLIDPSVDPHAQLAPFFSLEIEKLVCPIDARLSCGDVNQFISRCSPRSLLVPHEFLMETNTSSVKSETEPSPFSRVFPLHELIVSKSKTELTTFPMKQLEAVAIDKPSKYIDGKLDLDLAARATVTDVNGKAAATISGVIHLREDEYVVEAAQRHMLSSTLSNSAPQQQQSTSDEARHAGSKRKAPSAATISPISSALKSHVVEYRERTNILLGNVDEEKLLKQIKAHDPHLDVYISQGPDNADAMLSIPALDARITLWKEAAKTVIETPKEETRSLLLPMCEAMEMRFAGSSGGGTQRNDLNVLPGKFQAGLSNKFTRRHVTNFEDTTLMAASAAKLRAEKKMERQALAIEKQQEKIEREMKKIEEITQRLHRQQMREANRIRNRLQYAAMCIQTAYRHHRLSRQQREEELKKKLLTRRIQERRRLELVMKARHDEEHEAMERKLMEREEKLVRLHLKTTHRRHHEQRLKRQTLEQQREERERMEMMREERLMRLHRKFLLRPTMTLETVPYAKNISDQSEEEEEERQRERHHHLDQPRRKGSRTLQNEVQPCQIQHNPRIKEANKTIKHKKPRGGNNSGNQERGNNVNSIFSIPYVVEDAAEFDYGDEFEDVVDESMLSRLIC
ncbi:hypothetical protein Poli38472_008560 [Pythium oligandrum]|uniref:Beta-Casp domain-containing protein n=1 Tax=Pythium oligandrum TaxID=41045 RepID=A0A8K1C3R1_PYTOL|nr:hypothetical protein Poli38472_008560 [Pythium oligandrum]|eukprot:TMW55912.1 hypothetical protein Poli38472_008560 [Pythium oligandrum]